jgi:hypothetical protein
MPVKLTVLLVIIALVTGINLANGRYAAAAVNSLFALGVLLGGEKVRVFVMGLSMLGCVAAVLYAGLSINTLGVFGLFLAGLGALQYGLTVWCLMQADVQDWRLKRTRGERHGS